MIIINQNLIINQYGQLIQITDKPEIVNGCKGKTVTVGHHLYYSDGKFTIAKNEFKGL